MFLYPIVIFLVCQFGGSLMLRAMLWLMWNAVSPLCRLPSFRLQTYSRVNNPGTFFVLSTLSKPHGLASPLPD